jgi:hypothetical protein
MGYNIKRERGWVGDIVLPNADARRDAEDCGQHGEVARAIVQARPVNSISTVIEKKIETARVGSMLSLSNQPDNVFSTTAWLAALRGTN